MGVFSILSISKELPRFTIVQISVFVYPYALLVGKPKIMITKAMFLVLAFISPETMHNVSVAILKINISKIKKFQK